MFLYNQYCPVSKAAEILGERWTIMIVRELIQGCHRFSEFHRNLPGISRSVLSARLRQLEELSILERRESDDAKGAQYHLTEVGLDLKNVVVAMGTWGAQWIVSDPTPNEQDPDLIMLYIYRHLEELELPKERVVVEFELSCKRRKRRYWLLLKKGSSSLCRQHPGFEINLWVSSEVAELQKVYMGQSTLAAALRTKSISIKGPVSLKKRFPKWMLWSNFAPIVAKRKD